VVLAPELMADAQMARHLHVEILTEEILIEEILIEEILIEEILIEEILIEEILIVVVVRKVADQKARCSEAILIVDLLVNGTAAVIADRADLRTWITDADLQRAVTLSADRIAMQNVVRQRVATILATEDVRLAAANAAGALVLRCKAVDRRSPVVDPVQADLRGHSVVSHLVAGLRLVAADQADLKWDRRG
jgi:hypothetical protein